MSKCSLCKKSFDAKNNKQKCCYDCFINRRDDLIEILHEKDNQMQFRIFTVDQINEAEKFLSELCVEYIDTVVDFDRVLDTIEDWRGFTKNVVVCLHANKFNESRIEAREKIWDRIESEQIKWGCMIFKRGSYDDVKNSNNFTEEGSKAWVCSIVKPRLFIDDCWDHVNSVSSLGIDSHRFKPNDDLFALICF